MRRNSRWIFSIVIALSGVTALTPPAFKSAAAQTRPAPGAVVQAQASPEPQEHAPAPVPVPFRTEILTFDSWTVTCREFREPKKRNCAALLALNQAKTNQPVFSWTIGTDESNKPMVLFQVPTGVIIGPGVELRLGKAAARKIPYTTCDNGRCMAALPVDGVLVRDMMAAANAEVVIEAINGQKLQFNIPMKGIDKAYSALQ